MTVGQDRLAVILFGSLLMGLFFGVVYDVFRIRRQMFFIKDSKGISSRLRELFECIVIFLEDVIFALFCSVSSCIFIFYMNSGRFRSVALVGMIFGFWVYHKTVGKFIMFCSGYVIRFVKRVLNIAFKTVVYPIIKLIGFVIRSTIGIGLALVYTALNKKIILSSAVSGFGITKNKGKRKNEEPFEHIRKSGGSGVHTVLHRNNNTNAV